MWTERRAARCARSGDGAKKLASAPSAQRISTLRTTSGVSGAKKATPSTPIQAGAMLAAPTSGFTMRTDATAFRALQARAQIVQWPLVTA
eukprot:COSAG04_NODE_22415_length_355_cov_0.839844_1_plen_89_part_01